MIGYEYGVRPDCPDDKGGKYPFAATRDDLDSFAIGYIEPRGGIRMHLDVRFGALLNEKAYAPGLIAGKVLIDDAPAGEYEWEFFVRRFGGRRELDGVK